MKELSPLKQRNDRIQKSLRSSVEHFRKGNDPPGLDSLLNSLEDMENLLEFQQYAGGPWKKIDKLVPVLQTLDEHLKNQDVIGLTDVLEFTLYPLIKELTEEVMAQ